MHAEPGELGVSGAAFVPKKGSSDGHIVVDDAGRGIVALLQKAADLAKADFDRAMQLAHRLSSELRVSEERARQFEAQVNHFRDRAARAEEWLLRIHKEVEQTFFENKHRAASRA